MKMANILLTCFAPSAFSCNDGLANELISSLASDLHRLQKSLEESRPTLGWCSEAMLVVKKAHSHFLVYFEKTKACIPWEGSTVVDDYMSVSLDLLDLCNLLKSALSGLDRRRMMVDFMVKTVKDASFTTMAGKIELERNEIEKSNNLFKFRKWREMYLNKEGTVSKVKMKSRTKEHILQPISNTISIISLFVFCSILHPNPNKIHEKSYSMFQNNRKLFSESVRKPGITFSTGRSVLLEKEMIEDALAAFTAELKAVKAGEDEGKLTERLDELKNRSVDLKHGIDLLESVINELFEDVIKGRKKVIDLITTNNHSL